MPKEHCKLFINFDIVHIMVWVRKGTPAIFDVIYHTWSYSNFPAKGTGWNSSYNYNFPL